MSLAVNSLNHADRRSFNNVPTEFTNVCHTLNNSSDKSNYYDNIFSSGNGTS